MKCTCKECHGDGVVEVTCEECDGDGVIELPIDEVDVFDDDETGEHAEELAALQEDARRVRLQAARLIFLQPAREEAYNSQLKATLADIEGQARDIMRRKPTRKAA